MATDWIAKLKNISSVETSSLSQVVTKLILLPIAAMFLQAANAVGAISNVIISPLEALGSGLASLVDAILGGSGGILQAGANATEGGIAPFGILGFTVAMGVVLLTAYIVAKFAQSEATGDLGIPFSVTDIPLIGTDEKQ